MAGGLFNTRANAKLNWLLSSTTTPTRPTVTENSGIYIALTTDSPTDSSVGTELTGATGYTTGGKQIDFGAAASRTISGDKDAALTWNNTGSAWTQIQGMVISDSATFPASEASGIVYIDGLTIDVTAGADFEISQNGIDVTEG